MTNRMSADEIKEFVLGVCDDKIFTDRHCQDPLDVTSSFMILALGGLPEGWDEDNLGCIWEWISKANPMSVNGMPTFFSCRIMHKDDAEICFKLIKKEYERRDKLKMDIQEELKLRTKDDT